MNSEGLPEPGPMSAATDNSNDPDNIIGEAKDRMRVAIQADADNYKQGADDLNFLKGDQWPEKQRRTREAEGRVCLTINKIPTFLQQVTNDQRQNRAGMKVSPVSEDATNDVASIIQGMVRHIEYDSSADAAYDTAANSAAGIGFGYFRFKTEYEADDSFDQVIRICRIRNAFTVHIDPGSTAADGNDMQWAFISEKMSKTEFKAKYPNATATMQGLSFNGAGDLQNADWMWEDQVRVAEYYKIDFTPGRLCKYADGSTEFKPDAVKLDDQEESVDTPMTGGDPASNEPQEQGVQPAAPGSQDPSQPGQDPRGDVIAERQTVQRKVMWYLLTAYEVLEQTEIKCKWIPVFPVYGNEVDVDGKVYRAGLIRNAKDPAMMYNFWMTSATEEVASRSKTPWIVAEGQLDGHENKWKQANMRVFPYMEYKPTTVEGQLAPPPSRQMMTDVPVGMLNMAAHASDDIKQTTGLFDSSLGAAGNATSGTQELAQQKQGDVTNYHYMDNFFRTLRHAGKCLIDMIPHYYDAERVVTCRGDDGSVSAKTVNQWDAAAQKFMNDIRIGKYDIAITPGPSYATMRAEASDMMTQIAQKWPKLMDVAGDIVVKSFVWPGADQIADRLKKTLPPNLQESDDGQQDPQVQIQQLNQQNQQLQQQNQQLKQDADKNRTTLAVEASRSSTEIEKAHINAENRKDVEELKGMVALLIERLTVPPVLAADVEKDITEPQQGNNLQPELPAPDPAQVNNTPPQVPGA